MHSIVSQFFKLFIPTISVIALCFSSHSQSVTVGNGICELPVFEDWSKGNGANPCSCSWVDRDTKYYVCSYGNCGNLYYSECNSNDCAGGQASPSGWYQGGGNKGFQSCIMVLPVELSDFKGTSTDSRIELVWQTLSERNCSHFEVYHSENGIDFEVLTSTNAAGNSTEVSNYLFYHQKAPVGINYYKLKIVDLNGDTDESNVIAVDNRLATGNQLFSNLYPNPANESIKFDYLGEDIEDPIYLEIVSSTGRLVYSETIFIPSSAREIATNLETLESGLYIVRINQREKTEIKHLTIQR